MYCADCCKPLDEDPMRRVRCCRNRILSTEAPLARDAWYPVTKIEAKGIRLPVGTYWLYEAPRIKIIRGKKTW
jgi:hypothetical protein